MRRFLFSAFTSLTTLAFAAGCGGSSSDSTSTGTNGDAGSTAIAQANVPRDTSPTVASADSATLVGDNDEFAFAMYRQLTGESASSNLFFSPYSISLCMSMVDAGAANGTATEIGKALDFDLPAATLFPAFDAIDLGLAADGKNAKSTLGQSAGQTGQTGQTGQVFALNVANSLWAETDLPLNAPFLTTLATDYGSGVRLTNFSGDPEGSRAAINSWVSGDTNGKIANLLPEGAITADTKVALVDAIYFDASWATPFDATATANAAFTTAKGTTVQVPTMHSSAAVRYASVNGVQAAELSYVGETTNMLILLPDAAHAATFDANLTAAAYDAIDQALVTSPVDLALPKFSFDNGTISLKTELSALGMPDAFTPSADFSAMSTTPTYLSDVYHQAFISVDEAGTEAAAATAVIAVGTATMLGAPPSMTVDHAFTIVIRDTATGTILFVGKVADPS